MEIHKGDIVRVKHKVESEDKTEASFLAIVLSDNDANQLLSHIFIARLYKTQEQQADFDEFLICARDQLDASYRVILNKVLTFPKANVLELVIKLDNNELNSLLDKLNHINPIVITKTFPRLRWLDLQQLNKAEVLLPFFN
jgi:hypothetical protein